MFMRYVAPVVLIAMLLAIISSAVGGLHLYDDGHTWLAVSVWATASFIASEFQ